VVDAWTSEYLALAAIDWIEYVQIFENRGAMMGASNPHPHGQIWSTGFIPDEPAAETKAQREYLRSHRPTVSSAPTSPPSALRASAL
jgi:UDPglucose--hexose-1-phosphate uridylyltransferase